MLNEKFKIHKNSYEKYYRITVTIDYEFTETVKNALNNVFSHSMTNRNQSKKNSIRQGMLEKDNEYG